MTRFFPNIVEDQNLGNTPPKGAERLRPKLSEVTVSTDERCSGTWSCVLQIVDVAWKAISPAVNDPLCVSNSLDEYNRLLISVRRCKSVLWDPTQ